VGVLGYMTWGLNISWHFDPLYERLSQRLGEEKVAELFPWNHGGLPSVYPGATPALANQLSLFQLSPDEESLLAGVPTLRASNNWVVGPDKSASQAHPGQRPHLPRPARHLVPGPPQDPHPRT
jgi:acyl-homoserine lactone acylase PvdQ